MFHPNIMISETAELFNAHPFMASETEFAGFSDVFPKTLTLEEQVLKFLMNTGNNGKTRSQIVNYSQVARTTVYDAIVRLIHKNRIEIDYRLVKGKRGRPQTLFYATNIPQGNRR